MLWYNIEGGKIISQMVGISESCDPNVDRVSRNDKSCHICSLRLKDVLVKYEKYGTLSIYNIGTSYISKIVF